MNKWTLMVDASTPTLWMGLVKNDEIIDAWSERLDRQLSEWMVIKIQTFLSKHGTTVSEIDTVIVGQGPGSFTGVRLVLTYVKTLGLLKPIQVKVMSSLHMMAIAPISLVMMDARAERSYVGVFEGHQILMPPQIIANPLIPSLRQFKPGIELRSVEAGLKNPYAMAQHVWRVSQFLPNFGPLADLKPLYLKEIL